jgi:hypothetical protein
MRRVWMLFAWLALAICAPRAVSAGEADILYRATAIVTGQGEENRAIGFRLCMEDVIVRVSGDYRLVTSGKARAMIDDAASFVTEFSYRDRLEGIPIHDEQGSYDRPHDLTVDFDRAKIDGALKALGSAPWLEARPRLIVFLGVANATSNFVLSSDGEQGFYMRDSFAAASDKIAVPIGLPSQAAITRAKLAQKSLADVDLAALDALAEKVGGDQALAGSLVWSDEALGWIAEWRLASGRKLYRWKVSGVGFDDAFRNALRGAAQVLSGNGAPES